MPRLKLAALVFLCAVALAGAFAGILFPQGPAAQSRQMTDAAPSRQFPLGTDDLGRDRLARLAYGTRISLVLCPAAALVSTLAAALVGAAIAWCGGWPERLVLRLIDVILSVPWVLLLISVRGLLPLNAPPAVTVLITFGLLAALGWAGPARIMRSRARQVLRGEHLLQARACGLPPRALIRHVLPNLRPALVAQFCLALPAFILSEADLAILGLGVEEPVPSWGNLLRQLMGRLDWDFGVIAPLLLVVAVVCSLQWLVPVEDSQ